MPSPRIPTPQRRPLIKETPARDKLGQADRDLLAEAVADGDKTVTLILATKTGEARDVAASVEDLGGTVGKRVDRIGYVRATVPTKYVIKTAGLADVFKVDLNSTIELDDPSVDRGGAAVTSAGPGASTPADNPYMPTCETGAVDFKKTTRRRRPRHHHRHPRLRRRPRPPGAAEDHHRRAQDRRLGDRDRPDPRQRRAPGAR